MSPDERTSAEAIRATFQRVISEGLKPEFMAGASDDQIDAMAAAQGAVRVPAAFREALRLIGLEHGLWLAGSSLGAAVVGQEEKQNALATLAQLEDNPLADAEGMLVLVEHQAYSYHVVDGVDLHQADPPVWVITEGEGTRKVWPSVTSWFDSTAPSVRKYRSRLRLARQLGDPPPRWAQLIRLDEDR
ncbi:hypothetical protein FHX44_113693 [Pseudonocardia hierapolitana]|uniref:SMI1/KNR4 family protein SUKH-1 n=1 Tax=Pseudonocardia hierapolitana TaxID=1128676 RepID=A0A561SSC7_9PSEU|nr:hypothetical protein [Pseudonocardia hierapolitana]TWF77778.1 hypothetical protein FHX44_113693 [Pseudonocardia hierapolitana]